MAKSMVEKIFEAKEEESTNHVLIVKDEEGPPGKDERFSRNVKEKENIENGQHSSIAFSIASNPFTQGLESRTGSQFRSFKRRSSTENFGQFGLLTPALALCPFADGVSIQN